MADERLYDKDAVIRWQIAKTEQLCKESEALEKSYYETRYLTKRGQRKKAQKHDEL